jgi:hypothetical protein
VCLGLRCDCLRDGDTEGVTAENMQTLRKPLEKCLIGACPAFPFDLADQPVSSAASSGKGAQAAAAGGIDSEGGTLVHLNCTLHAPTNTHARSLAITITFIRTLRFLRSYSPHLCRSCPLFHSWRVRDFSTSE